MEGKGSVKYIIHLDMDAFYPAVEVLDNPELRGKSVIVGGGKKRGVVASASYEARKFGIHSAQPIAEAARLCPKGIFLPVRMLRYKEFSERIFEIFHRFTPLVEPLSIDEAFLDVTGSTRLFGHPVEIAKKIKGMVFHETGLTVSAGVAPSKFVAKIASDMEKPDGLTVVSPEKVSEFLDPLPIKKMWGVGRVTQKKLAALNIQTFKELSRMPVHILEKKFGTYGLKMHQLSKGIDEREVVPEHDAKSIGHEETFSDDIVDVNEAKQEVLSLADRVSRRMRRKGVIAKTITLKVKYSDFVRITRSRTLPKPTEDGLEIYSIACSLLEKTQVGQRPVRLLGVSVSQLDYLGPEGQLSLFDQNEAHKKRKVLNKALDSLCDKHGEHSIRPGTLFSE